MIYLRQSTAGQEIPLGYFLDSADGNTEETGLTIANTDIKLWKAGATTLANKNSGGATHISNGIYYAVLDATDTDTLGSLVIFIHVAGALSVKLDCVVLDELVYDSMIAASDNLQVDLVQWLGTAAATPTVAGVPEVDVTHWLGTASATPTVAGVPEVDITHINGGATSGNNATLSLAQLNIVNSGGSAIVASSTGGNGHGIAASGNGNGNGLSATGGSTGNGISGLGGSTSGAGMRVAANTGTNGNGLTAQGRGTGRGIEAGAASSGAGVYITSGTGHGVDVGVAAGTTGHGIRVIGASHGISATASNGGHGMNLAGQGSGHGLNATGGATGNGIDANGGATSGDGINAAATTSGDGMALAGAGGGYDLNAVVKTDGIVGASLSSGALEAIADAILKRDWVAVTGEASRSALNALRFLRNKWSVSGSALTVTEEDDTTTAWTAAVTTDAAADPVTGSDPA